MINLIAQFLKIAGFIFDLYREQDKKKAAEKAAIGKELIDALSETHKARRTTYLNNVVVKLRK